MHFYLPSCGPAHHKEDQTRRQCDPALARDSIEKVNSHTPHSERQVPKRRERSIGRQPPGRRKAWLDGAIPASLIARPTAGQAMTERGAQHL
ncbi:MAG: hypothetical protein OHK0018_10040 [Erythrobacter tepidarius]